MNPMSRFASFNGKTLPVTRPKGHKENDISFSMCRPGPLRIRASLAFIAPKGPYAGRLLDG
jgi:hypothetical protein